MIIVQMVGMSILAGAMIVAIAIVVAGTVGYLFNKFNKDTSND